jgi:hypothetical protein
MIHTAGMRPAPRQAVAGRTDGFSLRAFHDRLWREGNVPIALQRWELLDDRRDLDRIEELTA